MSVRETKNLIEPESRVGWSAPWSRQALSPELFPRERLTESEPKAALMDAVAEDSGEHRVRLLCPDLHVLAADLVGDVTRCILPGFCRIAQITMRDGRQHGGTACTISQLHNRGEVREVPVSEPRFFGFGYGP